MGLDGWTHWLRSKWLRTSGKMDPVLRIVQFALKIVVPSGVNEMLTAPVGVGVWTPTLGRLAFCQR